MMLKLLTPLTKARIYASPLLSLVMCFLLVSKFCVYIKHLYLLPLIDLLVLTKRKGINAYTCVNGL